MTDPRDKQAQRDRYLKSERHHRTREEEQQLADARKGDRGRRSRKRRQRDDDGDGDGGVQRMRRREQVLGRSLRQTTIPNTAEHTGLIVWLSRGRAKARIGDREVTASLSPELAATQQTSVAVGDEVTVHEREGDEYAIVAVHERRSELVRTDPGNEQRCRVLAANVDIVVLVLTSERPRTGLIDRLSMALADSGARLLVCVNKIDLEHDADELQRTLQPHQNLGVPIVQVSATRGDNLDELAAITRSHAVAFVGHSGVGKSTLLNRLDPGDDEHAARKTSAVREHDGKGRHTTTASSLRVLDDGTRLIDTPGVRAFGLPEGKDDAVAAFADVLAFADACRFRDCAHQSEPGCAVRAAAESGALDEERYRAFLRIC